MLKKILLLTLIYTLFALPLVHSAISDNIISYYKLDEGTGTTTQDALLSYNGTLDLNLWNSTSKINAGMYGVLNNSVEVSTFAGVKNVTFNAWINMHNYNASATMIVGGDDVASAPAIRAWQFRTESDGKLGWVHWNQAGSIDTLFTTQTMSKGVWYMVTGTYDGTTIRLYINGVQNASKATTASGSIKIKTGAAIGKISNNYDATYFDGAIDEVGIWSQAKSAAEITSLYNSGSGIQYPFTTSVDSCTYSGTGQWLIQISDNCTLNNYMQVNNSLRVNGTGGTLTVNNTILAKNISLTPSTFNLSTYIVRIINRAGVQFSAVK
jgi:hypothetical protein